MDIERVDLVLYYKPSCPYCHKVLDALKQMGKSLPMKNINEDKQSRQELEKAGKVQVPCLFINGQPLYESDHIIKWLEANQDRF